MWKFTFYPFQWNSVNLSVYFEWWSSFSKKPRTRTDTRPDKLLSCPRCERLSGLALTHATCVHFAVPKPLTSNNEERKLKRQLYSSFPRPLSHTQSHNAALLPLSHLPKLAPWGARVHTTLLLRSNAPPTHRSCPLPYSGLHAEGLPDFFVPYLYNQLLSYLYTYLYIPRTDSNT